VRSIVEYTDEAGIVRLIDYKVNGVNTRTLRYCTGSSPRLTYHNKIVSMNDLSDAVHHVVIVDGVGTTWNTYLFATDGQPLRLRVVVTDNQLTLPTLSADIYVCLTIDDVVPSIVIDANFSLRWDNDTIVSLSWVSVVGNIEPQSSHYLGNRQFWSTELWYVPITTLSEQLDRQIQMDVVTHCTNPLLNSVTATRLASLALLAHSRSVNALNTVLSSLQDLLNSLFTSSYRCDETELSGWMYAAAVVLKLRPSWFSADMTRFTKLLCWARQVANPGTNDAHFNQLGQFNLCDPSGDSVSLYYSVALIGDALRTSGLMAHNMGQSENLWYQLFNIGRALTNIALYRLTRSDSTIIPTNPILQLASKSQWMLSNQQRLSTVAISVVTLANILTQPSSSYAATLLNNLLNATDVGMSMSSILHTLGTVGTL
jgi:hypothetical protein